MGVPGHVSRHRPEAKYCNFCGNTSHTHTLYLTRGKMWICQDCAHTEGLCEICGSIRAFAGQPADEQAHFEEECFQ